MTSCPRNKPHRIALYLSTEDRNLLIAVVNSEKDTITNVIRRMIRAHHGSIFAPRQQALTLLLPQSNSDFANLSNIEKDLPK